MNEPLAGEGFRLRRAEPGDVEFLASLATHPDVEPFMGTRAPREPSELREELERAESAPSERGRFVIEVDEDGRARPAGALAFELVHRRSGIAELHRVMLHPAFRGRGIATTATRLFARYLILGLGYHRVQLECYGFNDRAIRHFERAGFVREGVRRKAYLRHGEWVDAVLFGLVREDLG